MVEEGIIRNVIAELYDREFTGDIEINQYNNYYRVGLYLNQSRRPLYISGEFETEVEFLNYLVKELKERQLHLTQRIKVIPLDNNEDYE